MFFTEQGHVTCSSIPWTWADKCVLALLVCEPLQDPKSNLAVMADLAKTSSTILGK